LHYAFKQLRRVDLLPVKKWFKLHAPQLAVAGTLLSFVGLALPSFLGGAFFWGNLRDLFNDDLRAGVVRV
jgi:hypothetical protein